jgi:hypothetical protein
MKHTLFALALITLSSVAATAQTASDSSTSRRAPSLGSPSPRYHQQTRIAAVALDSGRSHAMRNGAIIGAVAGTIAGVVGSTYIGFGCLTSSPSNCSTSHPERNAALALGITGAVAGALVGP